MIKFVIGFLLGVAVTYYGIFPTEAENHARTVGAQARATIETISPLDASTGK